VEQVVGTEAIIRRVAKKAGWVTEEHRKTREFGEKTRTGYLHTERIVGSTRMPLSEGDTPSIAWK